MTAGSERVAEILAWLKRRGTKRNREGMARYAITAPKVFGVSVSAIRKLGKRIGRDHDLAGALWETGWHEARMLAAFIEEPRRVSVSQMNRWVQDFDNWAICDTVCFHLFDRVPHAWHKVEQLSRRRDEFVKRAAFALIASLAVHDKEAPDASFVRVLPLIERAATDERNFVRKSVSWALRSIGKRNRYLNKAALDMARRLVESRDKTARWVGRDALRDLTSATTRRRLGQSKRTRRTRQTRS